jgi:RNA polymerase sigma factor (TIGR02999 family)
MDRWEVSLTEQLRRLSNGDREIADAVLRAVLPRLRQIAAGHLAREGAAAPLSATELIHEAWLRSLGRGGWHIQDREHFYSLAAHAMRRVLIDCARARLTQARGGGNIPLPLDEDLLEAKWGTMDAMELVEIGLTMDRLDRSDPLAAKVIELHYFAGFTLEEAARLLNLSHRQIRHRWAKGKRHLQESLSSRFAGSIPDRGRSDR